MLTSLLQSVYFSNRLKVLLMSNIECVKDCSGVDELYIMCTFYKVNTVFLCYAMRKVKRLPLYITPGYCF